MSTMSSSSSRKGWERVAENNVNAKNMMRAKKRIEEVKEMVLAEMGIGKEDIEAAVESLDNNRDPDIFWYSFFAKCDCAGIPEVPRMNRLLPYRRPDNA